MLKATVHIAVPTAFNQDESLNVEATLAHIHDLHRQGAQSVLVSGSTGEQHSMNLEEKLMLLQAVTEDQKLCGHMEIIFGVASIREIEAVKLAAAIRGTGVAGILLGYPPYILPSQAEAVRYSEKIAEASNKPVILYNNPRRTGFDLSVDAILQLSRLEQVIGIKEAGDPSTVEFLRSKIDKEFYYYAGGDTGLEDKVKLGFNRLSSMAGNVYPVEIANWFGKLLSGEPVTQAEREQMSKRIDEVFSGAPLLHLKAAIQSKGISMGICRSPLGNSVDNIL